MRRLLVLAAALAFAPAAHAAAPVLSAEESGLAVVLSADAPVHWDFGDGQSADGQTVSHTYAQAGRYAVTATATDGETTTLETTARVLTLSGPPVVGYGQRASFHGVLEPAARATVTLYRGRRRVGSARTLADGTFRISAKVSEPSAYTAAAAFVRSAPVSLTVRPLLLARFLGSPVVGSKLQLRAQLHPGGTNRLRVTILRDGKLVGIRTFGRSAVLQLDTSSSAQLRLRIATLPGRGYAPRSLDLMTLVAQPRLSYGTSSSSVARLTDALAARHYLVPRTSSFDGRVLDAVYAFQKVEGLRRTGVVDPAFWARLEQTRTPRPRYSGGDHLEVDKTRQVLLVVRGGKVAQISPVSTGADAAHFTPVGRFAIYRKVTGFDPSPLGVLWDPMYFTGGYAIHGNPSVPPYPASHGCIRVPMWIASLLYETNDYGETVYVY
jgi:N-acetylmuramoyl-L-alanine amidase